MEATKIVDDILKTAKERIMERQIYFESSGTPFETLESGILVKIFSYVSYFKTYCSNKNKNYRYWRDFRLYFVLSD